MKSIPIVVVGYNRPNSLERVLRSLLNAHYPAEVQVPLHISVDGGGPNGTAEVANSFIWPFGQKHTQIRSQHLGMRENSVQSIDAVISAGAAVFIEDDSVVSPFFYEYCLSSYERYFDQTDVFAVSLYAMGFCEFDQHRFSPIQDGFDNYFMSSATTWAAMFLRTGWLSFRHWLRDEISKPITASDNLPVSITNWPKTSWKRFLNKFLSKKGSYFSYPRVSFSANYTDQGTHFSGHTSNFCVELAFKRFSHRLSTTKESRSIYDPFYEIDSRILSRFLGGVDPDDLDVDLRQIKVISQLRRRYAISTRVNSSPMLAFGDLLFPLESNILNATALSPRGFQPVSLGERKNLTDTSNHSAAYRTKYYHGDLGVRREIGLMVDRAKLAASRMRLR